MPKLETAQTSTANTDVFLPPPYPQPHVRRQLDDLLQEVADAIAPVWPLKDYVAVNPYAGLSDRSFADARAYLKVFSNCETLMPLGFFAQQYEQGRFSAREINQAIEELGLSNSDQANSLSAASIVDKLKSISADDQPKADRDMNRQTASANKARAVRSIAEYVDGRPEGSWTENIRNEISKHCAAHYDQGQAVWSSPWKNLSLYESWRASASLDRNIEVLGLTGFRKFVNRLPHSPDAAIVSLLQWLNVPERLWGSFLLCQAFTIPGWSAWAKYQSAWSEEAGDQHQELIGLLAIRLAYDVALSQRFSIQVNWSSLVSPDSASFQTDKLAADDDSVLRQILLRASEIAYRDGLLHSISAQPAPAKDAASVLASAGSGLAETSRPLAQMVFCIDVRSERIRRNLESVSSEIDTFGFAGFFGMPIEFVPIGAGRGDASLPVLLKPEFRLHEGLRESAACCEQNAISNRETIRSWRRLWKDFQSSATGCFSFVETTGLFFAWKLLTKAVGFAATSKDYRFDGISGADRAKLGPTLRGLNQQGVTTSRQADLAESMLKNLGLTEDFGRLVVFCGHASQTDNNPLAAGLDCGACGGHSGEPNARLAALLLNQSYIRSSLAERGIAIPEDTYFLAGLHNTTTDSIEYFDLELVPDGHRGDVDQLQGYSSTASQLTQKERMPIVAAKSLGDLINRSSDWSEVRPEWGLAGNAAFIVAPRALTKHSNLDGRSFLHSYDYRSDPDGVVLETIMTAPMIVAHWINMQYYASTVDNHHFGSGNKTIHNVVGRFGILSGNSGDLMTGLPWQSLHTGAELQHLPMRLQVVIAAPRKSIERVIEKHELVANLLSGGWLHLVAIDDQVHYRYTEAGQWETIDSPSPQQAAHRVLILL